MTSGDWTRVTRLFDEARERPAAERDAWLLERCDDEAIRTEVDALLRAYEADPDFLEAPADATAAVEAIAPEANHRAEGRRIGPYRVIREVGRGGMGVVFEARREGVDFEQRVAIKLLPAAWAEPVLADRFRFERRVLAGLDHPNIARLLDGGTTEEGVPYFVMEFVDGQRIDAWCRARDLSTRARVDLVMAVCDAVAHAHQHLVVHRDLKPANVLITADGRPKLLDFGIATLVSDESGTSAGLTRTGQGSFTPEYASPEQVRGERVTTASDVYSLGVLLYGLLAGRPPYSLAGRSPLDAMRTICEADPAAPSTVADATEAGALRGDLDAVVLKALRKDPRERYVSVSELSSDLAAWLDRRPVSAARATLGYRARKFAARHKTAVAAAAAVLLSIVAGGATTAWQARVAALERDKAQNRFREVRQFSRSLLFEVHESLRGLPGATEPRRLLLDRAVAFLDGLAADADDDDALLLEVAEGYRRLGHVQGSAVSDNVGDVRAAIASFEKAVRFAAAALERRSDDTHAIGLASGAYDDLAGALADQGHAAGAAAADARHRGLTERLVARNPADPGVRAGIAASLVNLGRFRSRFGDHAAARADYERALAIFEALPSDVGDGDDVLANHAFVLKRLGALALASGDLEGGERRYREALALDERLVARHPADTRHRYNLTFSLSDLAFAAGKRGNTAEAIALWRRALDIRQAALDADPKNVRAMQGVANLHAYLAHAARDERRYDDQVAHWRTALELRERLLAAQGPLPRALLDRASVQAGLASSLLDLAASASAGTATAPLRTEARALLAAARATATPLAAEQTGARDLLAALEPEERRAAGR
ncbi:MAG: protein kinase [Acidobacteria bacterium]|nr:protein kinase [Acidobacteriota bacterium]